jgi:hypothetical protein
VYSGISLPTFLRDVLPPSSGSKCMTSNQQEVSSKQSVGCLVYPLTLKTETGNSSENQVNFYHTTRRHIAEDIRSTFLMLEVFGRNNFRSYGFRPKGLVEFGIQNGPN